MALYFFMSVSNYTLHGLLRDTDNLVRDRVPGLKPYMVVLICAEIGGWLVLSAGFLDKQIF